MKIKITLTREDGESGEQFNRAKQEALRMTAFALGDTRKLQLSSNPASVIVTAEGAPHPDHPAEVSF